MTSSKNNKTNASGRLSYLRLAGIGLGIGITFNALMYVLAGGLVNMDFGGIYFSRLLLVLLIAIAGLVAAVYSLVPDYRTKFSRSEVMWIANFILIAGAVGAVMLGIVMLLIHLGVE